MADDERSGKPAACLLHDPPVADPHLAVCYRSRAGIVADDQRRTATFAHELTEEAVDGRGGFAVELSRGLVGEQKLWPVGKRGTHGDALLLAAGELGRPGAAAGSQTHTVQHLVCGLAARSGMAAEQAELKRNRLAAC